MKIGIYGGTFSPPHNGHIRAAEEFYRQYSLDRLFLVPAAIPPHKKLDKGDIPMHRRNMLELAISQSEHYKNGIYISDFELFSEGVSYTVKTLEHFSSPDCELYFLCGTDMLLTLDEWYMPEKLFSLCTVVWAYRDRRDFSIIGDIQNKISFLKNNYNASLSHLNFEPLPISSTEIRNLIYMEKDVSGYICPEVYRYILNNKLYRGNEI